MLFVPGTIRTSVDVGQVSENDLNTCRAVLLDAAGTLLTVFPSVGHVYADQAAQHGFELCPDALNKSFQSNWRVLRHRDGNGTPFQTSEIDERSWWRTFALTVYFDVDVPDQFQWWYDRIFDGLYKRFSEPEVWHLYDDVIPALDGLIARGMRLAVVSNWDSRLPALLEKLGLSDRFEFVLTSAEAGLSKPHPHIFQEAARRLALPPESIVHVGDSDWEDIEGAAAAGIHGILLDRTGRRGNQPDTIRSLTEILTLDLA